MRRPGRATLCGSVRVSLCLIAAWALAVLRATAAPVEPEPFVLWYRNGVGCPEGAAFLARLGEDAARVRLAQAGDRVDFVLTMEQAGTVSIGRLERQTADGTIAVSELKDASCEAVAEGLALSLSLALQPEVALSSPSAGTAPPPPSAPPSEDLLPRSAAAAAESVRGPITRDPKPAASSASEVNDAPHGGASPPERTGVRLGAAGGVNLGFMPNPAGQGSLYAELDRLGASLPSDFAVRIGAVGMVGSTNTRAGRVTQLVVVERTALCPVRWGDRLSLAPCALLDLGVIGGSGSRATGESDVGFWAAGGAELSMRWEAAPPVAVELSAAGVGPLTRYAVADAGGNLYETGALAFSGSVGISFRLE